MQARYTFLAIIFLTLCSCGNTQKSVEKGSNIVTETILARRSVRSYKNLPVERKMAAVAFIIRKIPQSPVPFQAAASTTTLR